MTESFALTEVVNSCAAWKRGARSTSWVSSRIATGIVCHQPVIQPRAGDSWFQKRPSTTASGVIVPLSGAMATMRVRVPSNAVQSSRSSSTASVTQLVSSSERP
jgi:hypothetical protein